MDTNVDNSFFRNILVLIKSGWLKEVIICVELKVVHCSVKEKKDVVPADEVGDSLCFW